MDSLRFGLTTGVAVCVPTSHDNIVSGRKTGRAFYRQLMVFFGIMMLLQIIAPAFTVALIKVHLQLHISLLTS
jgi:hypothetical protein